MGREEAFGALKKMKSGKPSSLDDIAVHSLKYGGDSTIIYLLRIVNRCCEIETVPWY